MGKSNVQTSRLWKFLLYPESMKPNAFDILEASRFKIAISPLHCFDTWSHDDEEVINGDHSEGEIKKPHYHIVLYSDSTKSYTQMLELAKSLALDPEHPVYPKRGGDLRQAIRYLTHEDHRTSKYHYNPSEVTLLNGFDVSRFYLDTAEEDDFICQTIEDIIEDKHIIEYYSLIRCLRSVDDIRNIPAVEFYRYARKHTIYFNSYITSLRNSMKPASSDD